MDLFNGVEDLVQTNRFSGSVRLLYGERGRIRTCDPCLKRVANINMNARPAYSVHDTTESVRYRQGTRLGARKVPKERSPMWDRERSGVYSVWRRCDHLKSAGKKILSA